jgi:hypothetical protein
MYAQLDREGQVFCWEADLSLESSLSSSGVGRVFLIKDIREETGQARRFKTIRN